MASDVIKSSNKSIFNTYNFTEKEKKGINEYLSNTFYEKELKFKRSDTEVECLTSAVKTIVDKVATAIGDKEPLLEISHNYLVGSMAEGTSIKEPDEYDFLIVLKQFSKPDAIRLTNNGTISDCLIVKNDIPLSLLEASQYGKMYGVNICLTDYFLSEILINMKSDFESLNIATDHGKLTIKSTTVYHHGPASVVKLLWKSTSETSDPLDILVDITPCIEQHGIHTIIQASEVAIPGHYEALISDDMYMLVPIVANVGMFDRTLYRHTFTKTEVQIVQTLSSHHKICYLILKYCFTNLIINDEMTGKHFYSLCSSYYIKTFVLRHAAKCASESKNHHVTGDCLITCVLDILDDMYMYENKGGASVKVDGIFGKYTLLYPPYLRLDSDTKVVRSVIDMLVELGKNGYSEARHEEFRKVCEGQKAGLARINGQNEVECHIGEKCHIHSEYI